MGYSVAEEGILAGHVQHILFCVRDQVNEADTKRNRFTLQVLVTIDEDGSGREEEYAVF